MHGWEADVATHDRFEVFERVPVVLRDADGNEGEPIWFDPGEVTAANAAEQAALEHLAGTEPPMARKVKRTSGGDE
jgi:hypothetical protein